MLSFRRQFRFFKYKTNLSYYKKTVLKYKFYNTYKATLNYELTKTS